MVLTNVKVYDLDESIIASGYPMRTEIEVRDVNDKDMKRIYNLTKQSRMNHAHGQWLTGVRVSFDLTFSIKAWVEAERYRFLEFVSSQSTMHKISKFDIKNCCNRYVDDRVVDIVNEYVKEYNSLLELQKKNPTDARDKMLKDQYLRILYNIPSGFTYTARMTTDYRCLLNIYNQRHDHRLPEWQEFCKEILDLPLMPELIESYMNESIQKDSSNELEGQMTLF